MPPHGFVHGVERSGRNVAGVVDEHVDVVRGVGKARDVVRRSQVRRLRRHFDAVFSAQLLRQLLQCLGTARRDEQVAAFFREPASHGSTDAL